jgi:hypothetical protein
MDMLELFDILIAMAKWFSIAAGASLLFGAVLVGVLAWLLNRPLD